MGTMMVKVKVWLVVGNGRNWPESENGSGGRIWQWRFLGPQSAERIPVESSEDSKQLWRQTAVVIGTPVGRNLARTQTVGKI